MKFLGVTTEYKFNIEGKAHTVTLSVEFNYKAKLEYYFVSAITETGFDLCQDSYGYFKGYVSRNCKLRSEASIVHEMAGIIDSYINAIKQIEHKIIVTTKTISANISGNTCYAWVLGSEFFDACNIYSKESDMVLSWYSHDVFKQGKLEVEAYRTESGQLKFRASEKDLYDLDKLNTVYNSDAFQNSKFAFFNYNECRRLLGLKVTGNPKRMSGLMPQDIKE